LFQEEDIPTRHNGHLGTWAEHRIANDDDLDEFDGLVFQAIDCALVVRTTGATLQTKNNNDAVGAQ
jgi:hypothetical protein